MEQASDEFASRGLIVRTANSRDELMQDLRNTKIVDNDEGKLEIMVVNIQKFKEDSKAINIEAGYNTNLQRIFFIDEAHRGYNPKGSFLANLLEADKNSIKIALTGTPLLKEEKELANKSTNNYLSLLKVEGYKLTPAFSANVYEYKLDVNQDVTNFEQSNNKERFKKIEELF